MHLCFLLNKQRCKNKNNSKKGFKSYLPLLFFEGLQSLCLRQMRNISQSFSIFLKISQYFSKFLNISQNFSIFLNVSQYFSIFLNLSQNFSIFLNISQYFSIFLKISQSFSIFLNISQYSSKSVKYPTFICLLLFMLSDNMLFSVKLRVSFLVLFHKRVPCNGHFFIGFDF